MKTKIILLVLTLTLSLLAFSSCKQKEPDNSGNNGNAPSGDNGGGSSENEDTPYNNAVFSPDVSSSIIKPYGSDFTFDFAGLSTALTELTGKFATINDDRSPTSAHEIVIGDANREITEKAKAKLETAIQKNIRECEDAGKSTKHIVGYAVYSEGNSLALVFNDKEVSELAFEYFVENYLTAPTLILPDGFIDVETFSLIDYHEEREEATRNAIYERIAQTHGADVVTALKNYLSMFDDSFYLWIADLYDPGLYDEEGNPLGGGFYAANSGRDTEGFLPDIETTRQVFSWLIGAGAFEGLPVKDLIPDKFREEMVTLVYSCQSPEDGYFYHPQWGKNIIDRRLSRDLSSATTFLDYFGLKPYWNTPNGVEGMYGEPPGAAAAAKLESPLAESSVSAVSKVMSTAGTKKWNGVAHLKTIEAWTSYLNSFKENIRSNSYTIGSDLSSQASQVKNRDKLALANKELFDNNGDGMADGGYIEVFKKTFDSWQLENGLWEECSLEDGDIYYDAINGLMKIVSAYNSLGISINRYEEAFKAAKFMVSYLGSDDGWYDSKGTQPSGCVDIYNPWVSMGYIFTNLKKAGKTDEIERLRTTLNEDALEMINVTIKKLSKFKRDDGSYSYSWTAGNGLHQRAPVSVKGVLEGDVNGATICYTGTFNYILSVLGIEDLNALGRGDLLKFLDRIAELGPVLKDDAELEFVDVITFDDDDVGSSEPEFVDTLINAGKVEIVEGGKDGKGNALLLDSNEGGTCYVNVGVGKVSNASCSILEWDMRFTEMAKGYSTAFQIKLSTAYMLTLGLTNDGKITVSDASSTGTPSIKTSSDIRLDAYEWNSFRIEYYVLDAEARKTATKVYINGSLSFVSNNFYGKEALENQPESTYTTATFLALKATDFSVLFDNITAKQTKTPYVKEAIASPDRIRDFEALEPNALPSGVTTTGGETVIAPTEENADNKAFKIDKKGELVSFSAVALEPVINCYSLNLDMIIDGNVGEIGTITLSPDTTSYAQLSYAIEIYTEGDRKLARLTELYSDGTRGRSFELIPTGKWVKLTIEFYPSFYEKEESSIVYLNGEVIGHGSGYYSINGLSKQFLLATVKLSRDAEITLDNVMAENIEKPFVSSLGETLNDPIVSFPVGGNSSNTSADSSHNGKFDFEGAELGTPAVPGLKTVVNSSEYGNNTDIALDPKDAANKVLMIQTEKTSGTSNYTTFKSSLLSPDNANCYVFEFDLLVDYVSGTYQLSFVGKVGSADTTITIFLVKFGESSIEFSSKTLATDQGSDSSKTLFKATTAPWSTVRMEYYPENGTTQFYIDGEFVYEAALAYSPENSTLAYDHAKIYVVKSTTSRIYLDNVTAEAIEKAYEKKTPDIVIPDPKPEGGEDNEEQTPTYGNSSNTAAGENHNGKFDFEGVALGTPAVPGLKSSVNKSDGNFIDIVTDPKDAANQVLCFKSTKVTSSSTNMLLTASKVSEEGARCYVFEFDALANTCSGSTQFALLGTLDGSEVGLFYSNVYFSATDNVGKMTIKSKTAASDTDSSVPIEELLVLDISGWFTFRIEFYADCGMVQFYLNDSYVGETDLCYKLDNNAAALKCAKIYSTKSTSADFYLDNITVEAIKKEYTEIRPSYGQSSNVSAGSSHNGIFDFEGSALGTPNIAGLKTTVNQSEGNYIDIKKDPKDAANKVLMMETVAIDGTSNTANFTPAKNTDENADCIVFEFDLLVDYSKRNYQFILIGSLNGSEVTMLNLLASFKTGDEGSTMTLSTKTALTDSNAEASSPLTTIELNGWTKIRFELYVEDKLVKIYADDTMVCECTAYYSDANLDATLKYARVYALKNNQSKIYLDNVTVTKITK